jgi:uncharacterized coiled-coil DUF342 family protein
MTPGKKNGLSKRLSELKKEIQTLRTELNQIDEQKEEFFRKKESLSQSIKEAIAEIKTKRGERDSLTEEVKKRKGIRRELNEEVRKKIDKIKELNKKKKDLSQRYNIKDDPVKIKQAIDEIERKIETEPMSFEKEKELMKKINDWKKKYEKAKNISGIWEETYTISKEIDDLRKKAENAHKDVQTKAKVSQEKHEGIISSSDMIDEMRKEEEEAFKKFIRFKQKFTEVNERLQEKLLEMRKLKSEIDADKKKNGEFKVHKQKELLKMKMGDIEEKIKRGEKLTTDDLLVFQNSSDNS